MCSLLSVLSTERDWRLAVPAILRAIRDQDHHIETFIFSSKEDLWELPEFDVYLSPTTKGAGPDYARIAREVGRLAAERQALWWQWSPWVHQKPNLVFTFDQALAISSGTIISRASLVGKPYGESLHEEPSCGGRQLDPRCPLEKDLDL